MIKNRVYVVCFIFFVVINNAFCLEISPEYIRLGITKKEETRDFYVKIFNNEADAEIVGVINQCGLDLEISEKRVLKGKSTYGTLKFNSGTRPGRFVEYVKIVYKINDKIKEKKIFVNWFNPSEFYSKISIFNDKLVLGNVWGEKAFFTIEAINTGNIAGDLTVNGSGSNYSFHRVYQIPPQKNKFLKFFFSPSEKESSINLICYTSEVSTSSKIINVFYNKVDGISMRLTDIKKINGSYEISVIFENVDRFFQILSISDTEGNPLGFDKSSVKRGDNIIKVTVPEKSYDLIKKSGLLIKSNIPVTDLTDESE